MEHNIDARALYETNTEARLDVRHGPIFVASDVTVKVKIKAHAVDAPYL